MRKFLLVLCCFFLMTATYNCGKPGPGEPGQEPTTGEGTTRDSSPDTTTPDPTAEPTPDPVTEPTPDPATEPTPDPSTEPTPDPTTEPTPDPTTEPTPDPTTEPMGDGGMPEGTEAGMPEGSETGMPEGTGDTSDMMTQEAPPSNQPNPASDSQLQSARGGTTGAISQVAVTYLKVARGSDKAGFFVQAKQDGVALFVEVDPATTNPALQVGDIISFNADTVGDISGLKAATAISNLQKLGGGFNVASLSTDVTSKTDLVSALDSYGSRLLTFEATIAGAFSSAGNGFLGAQIETTGIQSEPKLVLRVPDADGSTASMPDRLGLAEGCKVKVTNTPMWRFNTTAQPSVFLDSEISIVSCPAPKLLSAKATSATTLMLTFSRPLDTQSVKTDGSQFTFDQGLTASAAAVTGATVEVTTGTQDGTKEYEVTAATDIKDNRGTTLDSTANKTKFFGFNSPATVVINEVNSNLPNGCDLLELRVTAGGSMDGFALKRRTSTVLTFRNFIVQKNDYIVVHFDKGDQRCNPLGATEETTAKDQEPKAAHSLNYDHAYDWYASDSLTFTNEALALYDGSGKMIDSVLLSGDSSSTVAGSTLTLCTEIGTAQEWTDTSGQVPSGGYTAANFHTNAADISGAGNTEAGKSIQRTGNTDNNNKNDWSTANNSTWGKNNAGQTDL